VIGTIAYDISWRPDLESQPKRVISRTVTKCRNQPAKTPWYSEAVATIWGRWLGWPTRHPSRRRLRGGRPISRFLCWGRCAP